MNYKTTLVLIVLLAVVGGYFYFVEYGTPSGYEAHQQQAGQADEPEGEPLFAGWADKAETIRSIRVERGGKTIVLSKEDGGWFQTEPVRVRLNDNAPQNVARQFAALHYLEKVTPGGADAPTLEDLGLTDPRAVMTVEAEDETKTLKLGKLTLGGQGYVQVEGDEAAYVVSSSIFGAVLDETVNDWRTTSLDAPAAANAVQLNYTQADGADITLNKVDGRWHFDSRFTQRVSPDAVDSWFSAIGRLWINEYVMDNPDSLSMYGLDQPYLKLQLFKPSDAGETDSQTLLIGNTDLAGEKRYAAWVSGDEPVSVVFSVNSGSAEGLAKTIADLRDPGVVPAETMDVRGLTVEQNGVTTLNLIRDPQEGFSFGEPDPGFEADYGRSFDLIKGLCELESSEYVESLDSLGTPIATAQLKLANTDEALGLQIFDRGEQRVVVSGEETVGYAVPADALDTLLGEPLALRKRMILEIEPGSIERVFLRRDDGMDYTFEPSTDGDAIAWTLVGHDSYERDTFEALIGALNPLRVERWLTEPILPMDSWSQLKIEPVGGAPIVLHADPATGNAVMSGEASAFVLPQSFVTRLNSEYLPRTVLDIPIDQIESVRLASNDTALTLSRSGQAYVSDAGEVDQALAAGTFDLLSALKARRYVKPLNLRPEDISYTVLVTTTDGEVRTLLVVDGGGESVTVTFEGPQSQDPTDWFTLTREDFEKLIGPLLQIESPEK